MAITTPLTAALPEHDLVHKPQLRGVLHQWAAPLALVAGAWLASTTVNARAAVAVAIYAGSLFTLFFVSALYHRIHWQPQARARMRRADHASIFILIAGTYTPMALLAVPEALGRTFMLLVWGGALLGVVKSLAWPNAPKALTAVLAVAVGWSCAPFIPATWSFLTGQEMVMFLVGGVAYTLGALAYATKRPNPVPGVFGYHEVFHAFTLVAAVVHFAAITSIVQRVAIITLK